MGAESESGGKNRIIASQEKAQLCKDILDNMDFSEINVLLLCVQYYSSLPLKYIKS